MVLFSESSNSTPRVITYANISESLVVFSAASVLGSKDCHVGGRGSDRGRINLAQSQ